MNIIVVDDERIILSTETKTVERVLPNEEVHSFQIANESLEFAKNHRVDIAFLDINMRGTTGLELAKRLHELNSETKIIFCTSYGDTSSEELDLYASAYLMKPITDERLARVLENLKEPNGCNKKIMQNIRENVKASHMQSLE